VIRFALKGLAGREVGLKDRRSVTHDASAAAITAMNEIAH
jgi:hypothetical protein